MGKSGKPRKHDKPKKRLYAIGIGSNRALSGRLSPRGIISAAINALDRKPLRVKAVAPIVTTRPLGPSTRDYANSAAIVRTRLSPPELLHRLQKIERRFGRQRHQRWGARTLDLDILLWEEGEYHTADLTVPHPALATRDFVLQPLSAVAAHWRYPGTGLRINHLRARLERPKPVDPTGSSR